MHCWSHTCRRKRRSAITRAASVACKRAMLGGRRIPAADDAIVAGTSLTTGGARPIAAGGVPLVCARILNPADAELGVLVIDGYAAIRSVLGGHVIGGERIASGKRLGWGNRSFAVSPGEKTI